MNEIQNSKRFYDLEEEKPYLFRSRAAQALAPRVGYWNLRPARSYPWPPRLACPPSAAPQANAGRAWLADELAMAGGFICNLVLGAWNL